MKKFVCACIVFILLLYTVAPVSVAAVTEDAQNHSYSCYSLDATESVIGTVEVIENDTERDNYMSAQEAVAYGLIDKVIESR